MIKFFLALMLIYISTVSASESYYEVKWSNDLITKFQELGYNPKELSKLLYQKNDVCSKKILDIETKKSKVCVEYRCGFITWYANIDKYLDSVNVLSSTKCGWF